MRDLATFQALHRFGLGPARGEAEAAASDPRGWVLAQIGPQPLPTILSRSLSAAVLYSDIYRARLQGGDRLATVLREAYRETFIPEVTARMHANIGTPAPFAERMVLFWSNHFTVSMSKHIIGPSIPAYEREVIRPHVFGRFVDMLKAVVRHPTMIDYLDNAASAGPNSEVGARQRRRTGNDNTLNENLAREVLELHTLGVNGGYTQRDVGEFAKVLSGWSHGGVRPRDDVDNVHGGFEFQDRFHEPGAKIIMGRRYPNDGPDQGLEVLEDLARHPSTATHLATKLARHFIADDPPADAVDYLARVYMGSEGDLAQVSRALVSLGTAWSTPLTKIRSHYEYVLAVHRATDNTRAERRDIRQPLEQLGQLPFTAPSPAGWGDRTRDWLAPESLMRRIEWVRRFAGSRPVSMRADLMLERTIGPVASESLRFHVERAPSHDFGLALILASPEFQRR